MKKLFLLVILLCKMIPSTCQITFDHTYVRSFSGAIGQEFFLTNIGHDQYKYVFYDYDSSKFSLFNLDHTPYILNIQVPVISNAASNIYYRLGYITLDLFDCDSTNLEYAMMLDRPKPTVQPNFGVYRTDGTVLFSKDTVGTVFCVGCGSGSYEMHPIMNTAEGPKLFLFNDISLTNEYIHIYRLCGTLPTQIYELTTNLFYVSVYPNPSNKNIVFELSNLNHFEKYTLTILSSDFREIVLAEVNEMDGKYILNSENLRSGVYLFTLKSEESIIQSGKFIVTK